MTTKLLKKVVYSLKKLHAVCLFVYKVNPFPSVAAVTLTQTDTASVGTFQTSAVVKVEFIKC